MLIDTILRSLTASGTPALIELIAGSQVVRQLPTEFAEAANRRVDGLLELADGRLLHLEWQSGSDPTMPWRMLWYWLLIKQRHPAQGLEQVVIQFGGAAMADRLEVDRLRFGYRLLPADTLDPAPLLASPSLDDALLSLVCGACDHPRDLGPRIRAILHRLNRLDERARRDALTKLLGLAGLRGATGVVLEEIKIMPVQIDINADPFLKALVNQGRMEGHLEGRLEGQMEGRDQGLVEGLAATLIRLTERRFGRLPEELAARIRAADGSTLELWLDRVLDAPNLEALFADTAAN